MAEFAINAVFVTGGAYGLGRAVVQGLARAGAEVAFVDIHEKRAGETLRLVQQERGEAVGLTRSAALEWVKHGIHENGHARIHTMSASLPLIPCQSPWPRAGAHLVVGAT